MKVANEEYKSLMDKVKDNVGKLQTDNSSLTISLDREENAIKVKVGLYILSFGWWLCSANSLTGARMIVTIRKRKITRDFWKEEYTILNEDNYIFNIDVHWQNGWMHERDNKFYTSDKVIDNWIRLLFEKIEDDVGNIQTYNK